MPVLDQNFYNRNTVEVAKDLLGCRLFRRLGDKILGGVIVETEAYTQDDPACHAYRGKTSRSITLFKQAGLSYVYFIYGMYHCVNIVTEPENVAGAVLIRAIDPISPLTNTNGPAKLCRELSITKELNEVDVTNKKSDLWVEKGIEIIEQDIVTATRIGIKQAVDYPWRFYVKGNNFVYKK